jgi:hypothetical protein
LTRPALHLIGCERIFATVKTLSSMAYAAICKAGQETQVLEKKRERFTLLTSVEPKRFKDRIMIGRLRKLNCFGQIVRRLLSGDSARSVAAWCQGLKVDHPEMGRWTHGTWCRAIETVYRELKRELDLPPTYKARIMPLRPDRPAELIEAIEHRNEQIMVYADEAVPEKAGRIRRDVRKSLKEVTAETSLKSGFVMAQELVETLMEEVRKNPLLALSSRQLTKALEAMLKSVHGMVQYELGREYLKGYGGNLPYGRARRKSL